MLAKLKERAENSLKGLKVVCYYGCLTSRPANVTGAPKPENPTEIDDILKALGCGSDRLVLQNRLLRRQPDDDARRDRGQALRRHLQDGGAHRCGSDRDRMLDVLQ